MWPPQSVKTWPTPACLRVRATSCPPVRSLISAPTGPRRTRSARRESRNDLGGDRLVLRPLVPRIADHAHDEVAAAGGAKPLELLGALLGCADDAVALGVRLEVLRVAFAEHVDPRALGRFVVPAECDEHEVRRRELLHRAAGGGGRGADLVEALRVAIGLDDVRHPAVALAARAGQRRVGAP